LRVLSLYTVNSILWYLRHRPFFSVFGYFVRFKRAIFTVLLFYIPCALNGQFFSVMDAITVILSRIETALRDLAAAGGEWAVVAAAAFLIVLSAAAALCLACRRRRRPSTKREENIPLGDAAVGAPSPPVAAAMAAFLAPPPPPPMVELAPLGHPPRVPGFN